jgi:uncharacterized protein (DUF1501 family)
MITRRRFMQSATGATLALSLPGLSFATSNGYQQRFILVILRGGLDGLAAIPAWGDPHYRDARGPLALPEPDKNNGVLDLNGFFGLHPSLPNLHDLYQSGELVAIHGSAPPYHNRSHFDAQNVLETGIFPAHTATDGWLYRALGNLAKANDVEHVALSVGPSVPAVLRGEHPVDSWAPGNLPDPDDDTLARVMELYSHDPVLGPKLASAMDTEGMAGNMGRNATRGDALPVLAKAATRFLTNDSGPMIAVLEAGGWDTHANQGADAGQLSNRLGQLDRVLGSLKVDMGSLWPNTTVLVVTEFGRTVAINGTRGTDHGVGGAAFMFGGAVVGKRVVADWQGLSKNKLFEGRDVAPGIDHRQLFKSVLIDHLGADPAYIDDVVFPGSSAQKPIAGLFRTQSSDEGDSHNLQTPSPG